MNRRYVFGAGVLVTLLFGVAMWLVSANNTPSSDAKPSARKGDRPDNVDDDPHPPPSSSARADKAPPEGFHITAPPGAIGPSTRPFEGPEAAASFVEDRVIDLFAAVSPQIDPASIHKSCEPDGRICTFDGPWPGDNFVRDWLRAISEGRTGLEEMGGVRFSEFKPIDVEGERRFQLKAHAP